MDTELELYTTSITERIEEIAGIVRSMSGGELNAKPAGVANSAWAIATHTMGSARAWVLGIACGQEFRRDRPSEFIASGDDAGALVGGLLLTASDIRDALESFDPARLDARVTPSQELWGEGPPREIPLRYALLHQVEHTSIHFGELLILAALRSGESGT